MATPARNHQPVAVPTRRPNAARAYAAVPPASGKRTPSAANVTANGADSASSPSHARIDAGPATRAASAGRKSTPGPRTAPTYIAMAERVESTQGSVAPIDGHLVLTYPSQSTQERNDLLNHSTAGADHAPRPRRPPDARHPPERGTDLERRPRR